MGETLQVDDIETHCEHLQYPVMRADAAAAYADVTVDDGDHEVNLGVLISELAADSFPNADALFEAIETSLERNRAGE